MSNHIDNMMRLADDGSGSIYQRYYQAHKSIQDEREQQAQAEELVQ